MVPDEVTSLNPGERAVWEALGSALDPQAIVYCHREVNGREFDICVLLPWKGILIIEVKGWGDDGQIKVEHPDRIQLSSLSGDATYSTSPKKQARAYRFGLYRHLNETLGCSPLVLDMVCYPFMSAASFRRHRLDIVSEEQFTLLKDDIDDHVSLCRKIDSLFERGKDWAEHRFNVDLLTQVRRVFEPLPPSSMAANSIKAVSTTSEGGGVVDPFPPEQYGFAEPYSVFQFVCPDESIDTLLDSLLGMYSRGTKLYLVVTSNEELELAVQRFEGLLAENDLESRKGRLQAAGHHDSRPSQNRSPHMTGATEYTAFNFVVVVVAGEEALQRSFRITDGEVAPGTPEDRFMTRLHDLTAFNYQQFRLEHADPHADIAVRAGAGTGKTFGMISRVTYLCYKRGYTPNRLKDALAMLTFTNEAADNMKQRLKQCFESYYLLTKRSCFLQYIEQTDRMRVSTIHSFARHLVEQYGMKIGYGIGAVVRSGRYQRRQVLMEVMDEHVRAKGDSSSEFIRSLGTPLYRLSDTFLELIERIENKGVDVAKLSEESWGRSLKVKDEAVHSLIKAVLPEIERRYDEELRKTNAVHLGALMVRLHELTESANSSLSAFSLDYLFVDEFQDTDDAQIEAILMMQREAGFRLFVVGDLKQCIYRFRGAEVRAFDKVQSGSAGMHWLDFTISKNYRTDRLLLSEYDRLFALWGDDGRELLTYKRGEDSLTSNILLNEGQGREVYCRPVLYQGKPGEDDFYRALFAEVRARKRQVEGLIDRNPSLPAAERTIAILVRENWQAESIRNEAQREGLTVDTQYGGDLYQSDPALDLYRLVEVLLNHDSARHLVNVMQTPYFPLPVDLALLAKSSDSERIAYLVGLIDDHLKQRTGPSWREIHRKLRLEPILAVIHEIVRVCTPWAMYSDDKSKRLHYHANLDLLLEQIVQRSQTDFLTLASLRDSLRISIVTGQQHPQRELRAGELDTRVRLLCTTVHKAKGLEYGAVILPFVSQSIVKAKQGVNVTVSNNGGRCSIGYMFPLNSQHSDEKPILRIAQNDYYDTTSEARERSCEETRILYVAMTRAIRSFSWLQSQNSSHANHGDVCWELLLRGGC